MSEDVKTIGEEYRWGFSDPEQSVFKSQRGLSHEVVEAISRLKNEPEWMLDFRLKALDTFNSKPMPTWGGDLSGLDLDKIYFYARPTDRQAESWDDVPKDIRNTYERLGIPEAERKSLPVGWTGG